MYPLLLITAGSQKFSLEFLQSSLRAVWNMFFCQVVPIKARRVVQKFKNRLPTKNNDFPKQGVTDAPP